uniref:Uncharacterized protein n=2 Tax=Arundo donax TaxID=35708 RepID=A0A0A9HFV4_ARUDO
MLPYLKPLKVRSLYHLLAMITFKSLNVHVKPRSQSCATESKLKLRDSTKRTLEI